MADESSVIFKATYFNTDDMLGDIFDIIAGVVDGELRAAEITMKLGQDNHTFMFGIVSQKDITLLVKKIENADKN